MAPAVMVPTAERMAIESKRTSQLGRARECQRHGGGTPEGAPTPPVMHARSLMLRLHLDVAAVSLRHGGDSG